MTTELRYGISRKKLKRERLLRLIVRLRVN